MMEEPVRMNTCNAANSGAISNVDDNELLDVDAPPADAVQVDQGKGKNPSSPFVCDVETCLEEFTSWKTLKRHSKTHKEEKPFKCDKCSSSFNIEYNLTLHNAIHQIGTLECPDCTKKFSRLAGLKSHIMIHEREETLICVECGDEFGLQRELKIHRMTHNQVLFTNEAGENSSKEHIQSIYKPRKTQGRRGRKPGKRHPKNVCHLCKKTFPKPSQLIRHIRIHTGEKPFKCTLCHKAFNQKGALKVHMKTHTNERHFQCDKCKLSFSQRGGLRAHYIRLHELNFQVENSFPCEECDSAFRSLGKLNLHITQCHSSQKDILALLRIGALQLHKQFLDIRNQGKDDTSVTLTENESPQVDRPVNQGTEESSSHKEGGGQENEAENQSNQAINGIIQQLLALTVPSSKEKNADDLSTGADDNNPSIFSIDILQQALEECGLGVSSVGEQTVNKEGKTAEDVVHAFTTILHRRRAISRTHTCQLCEKNFKRPCQLKRHVKSHIRRGHLLPEDADILLGIGATGHSKQLQGEGEKAKEDSDVNEPKSQAKTAEDVVKNFTAIIQRRRIHTCQFCTKHFKKPSDLVRHVRIHTKEKPFKCDVCPKSFTVKSTLSTHLKTHSGVKDYQCHVCQKCFTTSNSLRIHLRQHTGDRPYECGLCPKRFFTSGQRNKHFTIHGKKLERQKTKPSDLELQTISLPEPFLITDKGLVQLPSHSNAPFGQSESFQQAGSSPDRPYKCGFCEKAFKKCSHLKLHLRTHTGERPYGCNQCAKSFMSAGGLKSHLSTHTDVKAYKCEICETSFTRSSSLNRHMVTHSDVRPFMCPCCEKTFKALRNCKKHMKTHKRKLFEGKEIRK